MAQLEDPSRAFWGRKRVERYEEELRRAIYFKSGGTIVRYPIGMMGMWRHTGWGNTRFRQQPADFEIERMLRLRKHAMDHGAVKVYQRVELLLGESGIVINDGDDGVTTWRRKEKDEP